MKKKDLIKQINNYLKNMRIETRISENISVNGLANELNEMAIGYDNLHSNLIEFLRLTEKMEKL